MDGVDVYDPVKNSIEATKATKAGKVAAWFLDTNYDGRTFCICQAFFPDKSAWEKLSKALSASIDPEAFAAFSGTKSLPFHPGEHKRVAVNLAGIGANTLGSPRKCCRLLERSHPMKQVGLKGPASPGF